MPHNFLMGENLCGSEQNATRSISLKKKCTQKKKEKTGSRKKREKNAVTFFLVFAS